MGHDALYSGTSASEPPAHAASLLPASKVRVAKGADGLGLFKLTEASHRQFCTSCGTPVLVQHPAIGGNAPTPVAIPRRYPVWGANDTLSSGS